MHLQMNFQACQIAANFTTDWALLIALTHDCYDVEHVAFKDQQVREFSKYFTVDMVTLQTWCWSLFFLMNWSFVSNILNTDVHKGFFAQLAGAVEYTNCTSAEG